MGYDGYKKILNSLYRNDGAEKKISVSVITSGSGFTKTWVSSTLAFAKSLKILEGNTKDGYQFTSQGLEYTKSLLKDDKQNIKKIINEVIKNSHLKNFMVYLENNKGSLDLEKLFKHIKTEAVFPEGKQKFELAQPYITGTYTLLKILNSADLIPDDILEQAPPKLTSKSTGKSSESKKRKKLTETGSDLSLSAN